MFFWVFSLEYLEVGDIKLFWTGHDGFRVEHGKTIIYVDPFRLVSPVKADVVLITHNHFDHYSKEDVRKIVKDRTLIVGPKELSGVELEFNCRGVFLEPWGEYKSDEFGLDILSVPAYNVNKFRAPGVPFHPKEDGKLGYLVSIGGVKIFHAGDSDNIPEYSKLSEYGVDVALLPVSGTYVMTAEEAAEAAKIIKPKIAVPMHWGEIIAGRSEAEKFRDILKDSGIEVVILERV